MKITFIKMHAQGNDFIVITDAEVRSINKQDIIKLSREICNRNYGIGADGLVLLDMPGKEMHIYNNDGSKAEMCGSALRCCCYLIHEQTGEFEIAVNTDSGLLTGKLNMSNPRVVTVEIGHPQFIDKSVTINNITGDYVSVGNPHFVVRVAEINPKELNMTAKNLSVNNFFVNGTNVEFYKVINEKEIDIYVYERGVGPTLACGTGAAAVVFCGQQTGLLSKRVKVNYPGGTVFVIEQKGRYYLEGEVTYVAEGVYQWSN